VQRPEDGSDVTGFGSFDNSTCERVLDLLEPGDLRLGQVVINKGCTDRRTQSLPSASNIKSAPMRSWVNTSKYTQKQ